VTIYEFIASSEIAQGDTLWEGTVIEMRNDNEFDYILYNLGTFYVELQYAPRENKIMALKPFAGSEQLSPYTNRISIKDLL
jgi:hypothetical protein